LSGVSPRLIGSNLKCGRYVQRREWLGRASCGHVATEPRNGCGILILSAYKAVSGDMMKLPRRKFLHLGASAVALAAVSPPGRAQSYPTRPVRIVVPLPAGSSPDIRSRIVAEQLTRMWGHQVIVENRAGGGGVIGVQAVLSTSPDGYTLLHAQASIFTVLPAQTDKPRFDVNRDLVPIGLTASEPMVFAVSPKLGINTLGEFITTARRNPHKFIIGTNPAGSLPHLAAMLFVRLSQVPITVVPSTGGTNEAIREIMGGRVHAVIESLPGLRGALDAGDLKALAIMAPERASTALDIPAAAETVPGLVALGWTALAAPKETPPAIVQQLTEDLRKVIDSSDTRARFEKIGATPFHAIFAVDLVRFIETEQKLWWPIVKEAAPK
jgi:tripartite-type tricarboxylate transporter receptor subunit TctC